MITHSKIIYSFFLHYIFLWTGEQKNNIFQVKID